MEIFTKRPIIRITETETKKIEDEIALEKKLNILVNGRDILSLYCSPSMIRELVTGLIMTEGIIEGSWCAERMSIEYGEEIKVDIPAEGSVPKKGAIRTSGCIGGITYDQERKQEGSVYAGTIEKQRLIDLFRIFQNSSGPYRLTGCIHSAALADNRKILVHAEDIGRHNAVDKLIGYSLLEDIPLGDKIMLVSGRLSSEIASKCSRWKIPILASRTAPTLRAVEIAEKSNITMIGFLREKRFNIYTHARRIV